MYLGQDIRTTTQAALPVRWEPAHIAKGFLMNDRVIVRNREELSLTPQRRNVIKMVEAGIRSVLPTVLLRASVQCHAASGTLTVARGGHDFPSTEAAGPRPHGAGGGVLFSKASFGGRGGRIFVVGGGKATGLMAQEVESILGTDSITAGVVNSTSKDYRTRKIEIVEASHPTPDERGEAGTRKMLSLKERYLIDERDLVVCLISGGGSALMPCPADSITLRDKQDTTKLLLASGANIREINVVRKHLSKIKGGRLGRFFAPATVVSLIISDVVGNDLESIASGPTVPDSSSFGDAYALLETYGLLARVPESVPAFLKRGRRGEEEETPKELDNCHNLIIGDNLMALCAMASTATAMGLRPLILTSEQVGDPEEVARLRAREITAGKYAGYDAVLIGGETTPKLPEKPGKGGRNQHYAAVTLAAMSDYPGEWVFASVGTDGSDFMREVAGAIVDSSLARAAVSGGVDLEQYVRRYDSNTLLKRLGHSLVVTGNTGTNVSDVMVYLLG